MTTPMNVESLKQIAEQALDLAKKSGADAVEVEGHLGQGMSVNILNQQVDSLEYDRGKEFTITVYLGKKRGSASTNDFSLPSIKRAVAAARDFATYAAEDPYSGLPDRHELAFSPPKLDLYFPWDITAPQAIELATACEARAISSNKSLVKSDGAGLGSHQNMYLLANSEGFMQHYASSSYEMHCSVIAEKNGEMQSESEFTCAIDPADLSTTDFIAEEANKKAVARLGARQLPTQTLPVLFVNHAAVSFWKYLIAAAMGGNIYRRSSFLLDKLGQLILPEHISLLEKPFLVKGAGSAPFDDEGVYTREKTFIDCGVFNNYFLSTYSGRQLGLPTTGNAGGVNNMVIESRQTKPLADLIAGLDKGLIVTDTLGQGVNIVNGDYSKGVTGFYVEKGKIQFPVEEITIASNLKDMYQKIVGLGAEQDHRYNIRTGAVLIDSMAVAGS
ncbi:MAG: metalloprotease PmbA [Gammaproteobacteria bacterium]|nr:metalloprotease PmbA [Gammaproteobacteria bacterium]